jgi:tetratricopeptide (TPR) repeat protein
LNRFNLFFLVESLHLLANHAGGIDRIPGMTVPTRMLSGGMRSLISRRLSQLPTSARPMLELAALMGLQLDRAVLAALDTAFDFDTWLNTCAEASIFDVEEESWRFSHAKVRDFLIAELDAAASRDMHRRVAEALVSVYPDGAGHYAALAEHWEAAQEPLTAAGWYIRAGKQAEAAYAPQSAIEYYQKALSLLPDDAAHAPARIDISAGLGKMLRWQTRFSAAVALYENMVRDAERAGDVRAQARALIGLSDVAKSQSDTQRALDYARQAAGTARRDAAAVHELVEALGNQAYLLGELDQFDEADQTANEAIAMAEAANLPSEIVRNLSTMGVIHAYQEQYSDAERLMNQAIDIARVLEDKRQLAICLNNLGEIRRRDQRSLDAIPLFQEALNLFRAIGYRDMECGALSNLGAAFTESGQHDIAVGHLRQVIDLTGGANWWGLRETYVCLAEALLELKRWDEAFDFGPKAVFESQKAKSRGFTRRGWRALALAAAKLGISADVDGQVLTPAQCLEKALSLYPPESSQHAQLLEARNAHAQENDQAE